MSRNFWQGFLIGSVLFGLLGMWVSPRRVNPWDARRRAMMRNASQLWRASQRATRRLAKQVSR